VFAVVSRAVPFSLNEPAFKNIFCGTSNHTLTCFSLIAAVLKLKQVDRHGHLLYGIHYLLVHKCTDVQEEYCSYPLRHAIVSNWFSLTVLCLNVITE